MKLAISKLKNEIKELKKLGGFPRIKKRIADYEEAVTKLEQCNSKSMESITPFYCSNDYNYHTKKCDNQCQGCAEANKEE